MSIFAIILSTYYHLIINLHASWYTYFNIIYKQPFYGRKPHQDHLPKFVEK